MTGRWWKWLLLVVCIGPLLIWSYDRILMVAWVGGTDLEVQFVVTDAGTGIPIPGAQVEVRSEGGFYDESEKQEFVLIADTRGSARKECRNSRCIGKRSGLGFTDTYHVYLPVWLFRAVGSGYEPSKWVELNVVEYSRQVKHSGPRRDELLVPVLLHKSRS